MRSRHSRSSGSGLDATLRGTKLNHGAHMMELLQQLFSSGRSRPDLRNYAAKGSLMTIDLENVALFRGLAQYMVVSPSSTNSAPTERFLMSRQSAGDHIKHFKAKFLEKHQNKVVDEAKLIQTQALLTQPRVHCRSNLMVLHEISGI